MWVLHPHNELNNGTRQALLRAGEHLCNQTRERPEKALRGKKGLELAEDVCVKKGLPVVGISSRKLQKLHSFSQLRRRQVPVGGGHRPGGLYGEIHKE